jgi:hypothetical protein
MFIGGIFKLPVMQKQYSNMKQLVLILLFSLSVFLSFGQTWENIGSDLGSNAHINDLTKFDNKLYAAGIMGVKYWDGSSWISLPKLTGIYNPQTIAVYNNQLYLGGDNYIPNSFQYVYKFNGTSWVLVGGDFYEPNWTLIKQLLPFNGQLISGGHFTSINGTTIYNVASWNGTAWNGLGNGLNKCVWNLVEHKGQLFASGDFTASGTDTTVCRIAKWDGLSWSPIDSIHRFNSSGPMISVNDDLIIGNVWDSISGIPMKGVAKWTGSNFVSMGNDLITRVYNFWIFNGELYLCGLVENLNQVNDDVVVLKWTGSVWQQVGQVFNHTVNTLDDFNNELFCGGLFTIPGSYMAKLNETTGIHKLNEQPTIQFHPNPTKDNIIFTTTEIGTLTISNQLGEIISTIKINNTQTLIETSDLFDGIYFLSFYSNKGILTSKLVKQ